MFEQVPLGIKIVIFINTSVNLLLLIFWFFILRWLGLLFTMIGLLVIIANIILGIQVMLLKSWARWIFVKVQILSLLFSIWPFLFIFTLGMNGGSFGERHTVPWEPLFTPLFWRQFASFMIGMAFPTLPMLFSVFCIFYLTRRKVKEQFR